MRIALFGAKPYDEASFRASEGFDEHEVEFLEPHLSEGTAVLAEGHEAVCAFVNDDLSAPVLEKLTERGVRLVLMRCAGFNNVDVSAAERLGLAIGRVPAYSPHAVAEHTVALMLGLNRHLHRAHNRVREGNFALDGLLGFDMHGKTAGVVGTGRIGATTARILAGFGCRVLLHDPQPNPDLGEPMRYVPLDELLAASDIVTLHCPLTPGTRHLIDRPALARMKPDAMLINTSRGALIDTRAVIGALKSGSIGSLGIDVYEEEADLFFEDLSSGVIQDDVFARLLTFPNVLVTGHQAFFTREALGAIAETTLRNATAFERDGAPEHEVTTAMLG